MLNYIIKRILMMFLVLLGVTVIIFTILYFAPGDPATMALGSSASPKALEAWRVEKGINGGYLERLLRYVGNVLHGDFGVSYISGRPVMMELLQRLPNTIILATSSIIVASAIGIALGVVSAAKQYSALDTVATIIALFGASMPMFWQGLMLILLFSVTLHWLPPSGFDSIKQMILPIAALGFQISANITRSTRSSMLEVLRQDYIRTARSKGQTEFRVVISHALRSALIPITTVIGVQFGRMLAGSVIVESIFSIPGIGKYMIDAINARNYASVQGTVLLVAFIGCFLNLLVDLSYAFVDPRLKTMFESKTKRVRKGAVDK